MRFQQLVAVVVAVTLVLGIVAPAEAGTNLREYFSKEEKPAIVLMHGINANNKKLEHAKEYIEKNIPGAFVYNAEIGNGVRSSWFMKMTDQVAELCQKVKEVPELQKGFHIVGFSQGGLVARGLIELCEDRPPIKNFISWVSPQAGQFGIPEVCSTDCPQEVKNAVKVLVGEVPYWSLFQGAFTFCQYWKDPSRMQKYIEHSTFLADLNNEKPDKSAHHKKKITSLNNYVLVKSTVDKVLTPRETAHFEFYKDTVEQGSILPLEESQWYKEDWLGLRTLNEDKRLHRFESPCGHEDYFSECFDKAFGQIMEYLAQ